MAPTPELERTALAAFAVLLLAMAASLQEEEARKQRARRHAQRHRDRRLARRRLESLSDSEALETFRFSWEEIRQLAPLLRLEEVSWTQGVAPTPELALCVLCARLAFPGRWATLEGLFGRSRAWLSTVFTDTALFLYRTFLRILEWHPQLTYERMEAFSKATEKVGGVEGIWGFVDGTFRSHQRPLGQDDQRLVFSGHKRLHGINYQAIVTPNGIVSSLTGPWPGPVNDWTMWRRSHIEQRLREVCFYPFLLCFTNYLLYIGNARS